MFRHAFAVFIVALTACGGRAGSTDGPTDTRVVGSVGDGPDPDAGDASGFPLDAAFADAAPDANWFADAAACESRPVATCTKCDAAKCAAPMVVLLEQALESCAGKDFACGMNVSIHLDSMGCATDMFVMNGNEALDACVASKLAAQRFPLAECTFSTTEAHTSNTCGPK